MAGASSVAASAIVSFGINLYVHISRDSSKYVDLIIKILFFVGTLTFVKNIDLIRNINFGIGVIFIDFAYAR